MNNTTVNFCPRCKRAYNRELKSVWQTRRDEVIRALSEHRDELPKIKRTDVWVYFDHSKKTVSFR